MNSADLRFGHAFRSIPNVSPVTEAALEARLVGRTPTDVTFLFTPATTGLVRFMESTLFRAETIQSALSVDAGISGFAEAANITFLVTDFPWERARFFAAVSTFGEELIVVAALVTLGLGNTISVDSNESWFAEAALFALWLTGLS